MKHLAVTFIVILCSVHIAFCGILKIIPESPKQNSTINFEYQSFGRFGNDEILTAFIYCFNSNETMPVAYESKLEFKSQDNVFKGKFKLPEDVIFAIIKVSNGKITDYVNDEYWDLLVHNNKNKPLHSANLKAAVAYMGNIPSFLEPVVDYQKALNYMEEELRLYPDNLQAQIGLTSLKLDLKKSTVDEFQTKIKSILNANYNHDNENDTRALIRAYRISNENEKAEKLETSFAQSHPQSELSQELFLGDLGKASSLKEFSQSTIDFLHKFPASPSREKVFAALITGYTQSRKYDEIIKILDNENDVPVSAYLKLAFDLIKAASSDGNDKISEHIKTAYSIIRKAINVADGMVTKPKPEYLTDTEWQNNIRMTRGSVFEALGQAEQEMKKHDEALKSYMEAKKLLGDNSSANLYLNSIKTAFGLYLDTLAYELATEAILNSKSNSEINEYHMLLFDSLKIEGNYKNLLDSLRNIAGTSRQSQLKFEMINKIYFSLPKVKTLEGDLKDIFKQSNKVTVIEFWATWCSPSKSTLLALEDLKDAYEKTNNLNIVAVNVWEKKSGKDRLDDIKKFFSKNKSNLNIYYDENNELPFKLGISGLPTRIYLDKKGAVRFKEMGFTNNSEFLRNAKDKIDLLISE